MLLIAHSNADIFKAQCGWVHTYKHNGEARLEHATQCERSGTPADLRNGQRKVRFGLCAALGRTGLMSAVQR
jgi:hypothetical protein